MNAAEILVAVEQAGATLRVEGDSLVATNASRIAPVIKTAIRENKPEIITLLGAGRPPCRVTIVELPAGGLRYRRIFAHLQLKPPALVDLARWQQAIADGRVFLRQWGEAAQRLNWSSADIFGLIEVPESPAPSFNRLSRYDQTGLVWLLEGREVIAMTETTATIRNPATGAITVYRRHHKPALGPLGDALEELK